MDGKNIFCFLFNEFQKTSKSASRPEYPLNRYKIEFWIFNSIFLFWKEKYTSHEKMLRFKLVDLYVVNNLV